MGQHKYNLTAIQAKEGQIEPKPRLMGKREMERRLYAMIAEKTGINKIMGNMGGQRYG